MNGIKSSHFVVWMIGVGLIASSSAFAQSYDFQENVAFMYFNYAPSLGPGVVSTNNSWSSYSEPGQYTNNGVTLTLSGFPEVSYPAIFVGGADPYNGTPAFTLGQSLWTNSTAQIQLTNIPAIPAGDTYSLYLYAANYGDEQGTTFGITTGGGAADDGISSTINSSSLGTPNDSFAEGINYVLFTGLMPIKGEIDGFITPTVPGDMANLNGLQLVVDPPPTSVPEPASVGLLLMAGSAILFRRRRV